MTHPNARSRTPAQRRSLRRALVAVICGIPLIAGVAWYARAAARERIHTRLLERPIEALLQDPELVAAATVEARPLFARHCAACHGEKMQGDAALGAPNLVDGHWLFGRGTAFDIERTTLYGVRSGLSKARSLSDMPPFGLTGMLQPEEIRELVQYLLQLSGRAHEGQAALSGRDLFFSKGGCIDCHGPDGKGDSDIGATDFTANVWNNGGDAASLYKSIYFGQRRVMPGWIDKLNLMQIRALSIYVYVASHAASAREPGGEEHVARSSAP